MALCREVYQAENVYAPLCDDGEQDLVVGVLARAAK